MNSDVYLNQFYIQSMFLSYKSMNLEEFTDFFQSTYSHGLSLILEPPEEKNIDHTNIEEFFSYLFDRIPSYAIVYPTETYYYYIIDLPNVTISGNLRLLDADEGKIHIGYFDKNDPHGESYYTTLGQENGVTINKVSDYVYDVAYNQKTVRFKLSDIADKQPKELKLLPEEEFVAHILDESGVKLFLLYNNQTSTFYYVMDEEVKHTDRFTVHENYLLGNRTGFVYYHDKHYDRKILVGVSRMNIFYNNYFDGPFDQVPPRLNIRDKLIAAYPYTNYSGGIDEHGNFNAFNSSRVAISPYYDYLDIQDLIDHNEHCEVFSDKQQVWSCLVYEWKKDFHKTLENNNDQTLANQVNHPVYVSQGWPANHQAEISLGWDHEHTQEISETWPKNHDYETSKG